MRVEIRIRSGSRAGQQEAFDKSVITIGRHPLNDLRFDPEKDPDVSSKHAEIHVVGSRATLRDLSSTNGTYVNGHRIEGERGLANGDVLAFGELGPTAEVVAPEVTRPSPAAPRRDTAVRIAEAVAAQTGTMRRTMRLAIGGLAILVVVGSGVAFWLGRRGAAGAEQEIAALIAQNDSLANAIRGRSAVVDSALETERRRNEELTRRLTAARASGDQSTVDLLTTEVQDHANRQRGLLGAAAVDWAMVHRRNSPAMAFLVVQMEDGTNSSGTAFNVHPSGLLVTNRHVVRDGKGRSAKVVVVKFDGAEGGFTPARVIKVSDTDELAWLKIDARGPFPVIRGIARDAASQVGAPMALIGYPLGTGTAGMSGDINTLTPSSTQTIGAVSKVLPDILQLDVFAAQGSSGSPVFNAEGFVIGVLYGSPTESHGRIIYAVPAAKLVAQMPAEGMAIVR